MNSIRLKTSYVDEKLSVGASKFFGAPDIYDGFEWPTIKIDGEEYDLSFIGQLNLAEASKFDKEGLLPKTGMLHGTQN